MTRGVGGGGESPSSAGWEMGTGFFLEKEGEGWPGRRSERAIETGEMVGSRARLRLCDSARPNDGPGNAGKLGLVMPEERLVLFSVLLSHF